MIWIVVGSLIIVNALVAMLPVSDLGGFYCIGCLTAVLILCGGAFILVGIQTIRGTARDTLSNGIGSIIMAFIYLGVLALQVLMLITVAKRLGVLEGIQSGFGFINGVGLLVAGVLALVGRSDYRGWRQAHKGRHDKWLGQVEQMHRVILNQGRKRFGPPSGTTETALLGISDLSELERLTDAILTVASWNELLAAASPQRWHDRPGPPSSPGTIQTPAEGEERIS
jgi:hypothetical protein